MIYSVHPTFSKTAPFPVQVTMTNRGLGDRPTERNEQAEQAEHRRVRDAREAARIRRVHAQRERADKEANKK